MPSYNIQSIIWYWTRAILAISVGLLTMCIILNALLEVYKIYDIKYRDYIAFSADRDEFIKKSSIDLLRKCAVMDGVNSASSECLQREIELYVKKDTENKDLQAQQEMANWALATVVVGIFGLITSIFGLIGLFLSLYQTRRSIKISETVGRTQTRAYLSVELDSEFAANSKSYPFRIKNSGVSPAKKVRYVAAQFVLEHPLVEHQGDLIGFNPEERTPVFTIAPGASANGDAEFDSKIRSDDWHIIKSNGSKRIYLVVRVFYDDFFGMPHETKFCAFSEVSPIMRDNSQMTRIDWIRAGIY